VQTRITDSRTYGNEYPLIEMMSDLTSAIFDADARTNVNTFRQNLQLEYVNRLAGIVAAVITAPNLPLSATPPAQYGYTSQSAAMASLRSIQSKLAGKTGVNAETSAHTRNVLYRIEKALKTD
jgi:hypothetical protein